MTIRKGFTLFEVLFVIAFASAIMLSAAIFLTRVKNLSQWTAARADLQRSSQQLSAQIRRDIAIAQSVSITSPTEADLVLGEQSAIQYRLDGERVMRISTLEGSQELEAYIFNEAIEIEFRRLDAPERLVLTVREKLPGIEKATRLETHIEAVVGSRLPKSSAEEGTP